MWRPVGDLPASVYVRRRLVAGGIVLLLVGAGVGLLASTAPTAPTNPEPATIARTATDPSAPQPDPPSPAIVPGTAVPSAIATTVAPSPTAAPTPSPEPPAACTDDVLDVTAGVGSPTYRVGQRPVLRLVVTNIGDRPCVRDLDPARQELSVWSGDGRDRLWSSNDCSPVARPEPRTIGPAEPVVAEVMWAGRTSAPGCAGPRTALPAGAYRVVARLDGDTGPPVAFLLEP